MAILNIWKTNLTEIRFNTIIDYISKKMNIQILIIIFYRINTIYKPILVIKKKNRFIVNTMYFFNYNDITKMYLIRLSNIYSGNCNFTP